MGDISKEDPVSKQDFIELKKELTAGLATKEELKSLREELLDKLASKEAVEVVARQVLQNTNDISQIKVELKNINWKIDDIREDIKSKFDAVLTGLDQISGEISNNRTEKAAIDHALSRHDNRFEDHEIRITQLERKSA